MITVVEMPMSTGKTNVAPWLGRTQVKDGITLYRICRAAIPTVDDMKSYAEMGIPLRHDSPEARRLSRGLSLFASFDRARHQALGKPWLGDAFIAELVFPEGTFAIEKTGGREHFTLWGDAHDILGYVVRVEPV